jgi:hypothetical protein
MAAKKTNTAKAKKAVENTDIKTETVEKAIETKNTEKQDNEIIICKTLKELYPGKSISEILEYGYKKIGFNRYVKI